jgi:hypothetical protein
MYSCPINNNLTYNFAGSPNGNAAMPAMTNVPYLYAFCFENGTKRSLVLINTDLTSSHTLKFGGINPPAGTVTQRQLAPSALNDMNEAATGTATNLTAAKVSIKTTTITAPPSVTLAPYSVTALDYTISSAPPAAAPTLSPAAGTYTSAQTVTISDTTAGASIYYTTDGTTPTTSSTAYTSPIAVNATETIEAFAVASGYSPSAVTSATYTLPMTFNISLSPASLSLADHGPDRSCQWVQSGCLSGMHRAAHHAVVQLFSFACYNKRINGHCDPHRRGDYERYGPFGDAAVDSRDIFGVRHLRAGMAQAQVPSRRLLHQSRHGFGRVERLQRPGSQSPRAVDFDRHGDGNLRSNSTSNGPHSYCQLSSGVRRSARSWYSIGR